VKRGRITNLRTAAFVEFSLNPSSIKRQKGAGYSEDPIPGSSHPIVRFASGKSQVFSFSLDLDGEMVTRRRPQLLNGNDIYQDVATEERSLSIRGEIEFYESFMYPASPDDGGDGPDRIVLTYGSLFPGVTCFVEKVDVDVTMWLSNLDPMKATLQFSLKRDEGPKTVFSNDIWTAQ
jgi:hypothetical protein